ncbi:MAG: 1-acyl-sn-glycerol-3-phosphate acyltransferase [Lachnospiraceae bacterium]|nr:1-acyl-sn-glycerol-3-phosphate acyltransferase [Lachnospiraceae bacterium]MBQ4067899.1 1-acyl-sn-glycerol-3-phosphate acyltransferase [Lachnospiraceae bacterium]
MNRIVLMVLRNIWKVPHAYWKLCRYAKHTEKYSEIEKYAHIQYIMKTAVESGNIDLKVTGLENIPQEDGFLMYSNHQGMFDIMALAATCEKPWAAVLKKELYNIPFMKQIVDCTKSFPMDREDIKQSMGVIMSVIKEVKNGRNYLIFPEGTRSKKGNDMLEFHSGSFKCALKSKCPVIPIALVDCFKVLDQKGSKPVSIQLHYLEPILYEEYKDMNTTQLANLVKERIQKKINESL